MLLDVTGSGDYALPQHTANADGDHVALDDFAEAYGRVEAARRRIDDRIVKKQKVDLSPALRFFADWEAIAEAASSVASGHSNPQFSGAASRVCYGASLKVGRTTQMGALLPATCGPERLLSGLHDSPRYARVGSEPTGNYGGSVSSTTLVRSERLTRPQMP